MNQEDGGLPHITLGKPPEPGRRVEKVYVLVATTAEGGEGVYGQKVGDFMVNFVAEDVAMKDALEDYLRNRGSVAAARRSGIKLEWVEFGSGARTEIT